MKVLIVGGGGFIGGVLKRQLADQGHTVLTYDVAPPAAPARDRDYIEADIRDLPTLTAAVRGQDVVVNLAAQHRDDVQPTSLYDEVNVEGARTLCAALSATNVNRLIFTSSVAVYGEQPGMMSEDTPHNYFNDYGRTKHLAEQVYLDWQAAEAQRSLTIVRPTVVFGPGNRGNVYNLLRQVKSRRFLMVGSGENRKSIAHVENIAGFLAHLLDTPRGLHVYNYADKPDLTMNELVALLSESLGRAPTAGLRLPYGAGLALGAVADVVSRLSGRKLPISAVRVRKFCMRSEVDASRAASTGYSPAVDLITGLRNMIRHHV